ncbi:10773_t:CDS:2 [Dentiscutata heterogama]|uniref:10773_t:CDS:1 n=1 Tax=Dentiscutata heterogama TaxID=1316150 RepID=A0ACA9NGU7_9GLOM|nr:10773_t:CDS:2 [Dentiscutata heterogama]
MTEPTLYSDKFITVTSKNLIIKNYYFPFACSLTIPLTEIDSIDNAKDLNLGMFSMKGNWCCNIIPLLWKQPFHFWKDTNEPSPKLTEVNFKFPIQYIFYYQNHRSLLYFMIHYLQNLDTEKLYLASRRWLENIEHFLEDLDYKEYSRALARELGGYFVYGAM